MLVETATTGAKLGSSRNMSPGADFDATAYFFRLGKNMSIVRSSTAIVSVTSSCLLLWILHKTPERFSTTYHRLLLGMSVADILFSLSGITFGAAAPSELSYVVWNARGNLATCQVFGFFNAVGSFIGLLYSCSLNLYYLAMIRYNKSDHYIKTKLEPWLHLVPISYGLVVSIVFLVNKGINATVSGMCGVSSTYKPPHCMAYENGEVPEGFDIPCGRGQDVGTLLTVTTFITLIIVPITVFGSLFLIYRSVSKQEQRIARYGAGAFTDTATADNNGQWAVSSLISSVKSRFRRVGSGAASPTQDASHSRAVMRRAGAYSVSYFLTWIWFIVAIILYWTGVWTFSAPQPKWQLAYRYLQAFFVPLQGMWTFLIFLHPNVASKRRSLGGNASWFKAFKVALWSAVTGRKYSGVSIGQTAATASDSRTKASATARGESVHSSNNAGSAAITRRDNVELEEEEKIEIQDEA